MESSLLPAIAQPRHPIGVFDSGVGGLSVWREIVGLLPHESTIYLADQAHVPYGVRAQVEIEALTHAAAAWLIARGAKLIVVACNTASAAALSSLRQRWPKMSFVGMEPAIKPASERTRTGKVGVMATPGTLQAERFSRLVERFAGGVEVYTQVCPGLVDWVEAGQIEGPLVEAKLHELLDPLTEIGVDHLVLGCTHYPFLAPAIRQVLGDGVTLIDPAPAVARQVERVLAVQDQLTVMAGTAHHEFFTTGAPTILEASLKRLFALKSAVAQVAYIGSAT